MCNLIRQYMGYVDGDTPLGGPDGYVTIGFRGWSKQFKQVSTRRVSWFYLSV